MRKPTTVATVSKELLPLKFCKATCAGVIVPGKITFDEWKADLMTACSVREVADTVLPLVIGQLLNQGEEQFAARDARGQFANKNLTERYEIVASHIGVKFGTISNWRSVERAVPFERRARFIPPLLYSHIVKVAPMDGEKQEYWLGRAVSEGMSCLDLQEAIERDRRSKLAPELQMNFMPNFTRIRVDLNRCLNQLFSRAPNEWKPEDRSSIKKDLLAVRDTIDKRIKALDDHRPGI
jgi:hypothetical protein